MVGYKINRSTSDILLHASAMLAWVFLTTRLVIFSFVWDFLSIETTLQCMFKNLSAQAEPTGPAPPNTTTCFFFWILPSAGFSALNGIFQVFPSENAPSTFPSVHKTLILLSVIPHFNEACFVEMYSILAPFNTYYIPKKEHCQQLLIIIYSIKNLHIASFLLLYIHEKLLELDFNYYIWCFECCFHLDFCTQYPNLFQICLLQPGKKNCGRFGLRRASGKNCLQRHNGLFNFA